MIDENDRKHLFVRVCSENELDEPFDLFIINDLIFFICQVLTPN